MSGAPSRPHGRPCRLQPLSLALTRRHPLPPGEGSLPKLHGLKLRLGPRKRPDPWTDVPTGELAPPSLEEEPHPSRNKAGSQREGLGFQGWARGAGGGGEPHSNKGEPNPKRSPAQARFAAEAHCWDGVGTGAREAGGFLAPGMQAGKSAVTTAGGPHQTRMLPTSSQRADTCWVSRIHREKAGRAAGPRVRRIGGFPHAAAA